MKKLKKLLSITIILLHGTLLSSNEPEKIYAVMITGKDDFHKLLAKKSIQSFLQQTYPNKHLIIVNDGNYSLASLNRELITEIKLEKKCILGTLRNIGIQQIPENGIYIQWDDDDWHHPNLMKKQYEYMISQSADACILKRQIAYCFKINAAWVSASKIGKNGTIMCRRKLDILYPELAKSEDDYFLNDYINKYRFVCWNNPAYYYIRFIHGHNTWDEGHFNLQKLTPNQWKLSTANRMYLTKIVPLYKPLKPK